MKAKENGFQLSCYFNAEMSKKSSGDNDLLTNPATVTAPQPLRSVRLAFDACACRRAIWLDYEGNKGMSPTLMGWRIEDAYGAAIVEEAFATCARRLHAKAPEAMDHAQAAAELVDMAVRERRFIVSWSQHDLNLLYAVLSERQRSRLMNRYVNALAIVRPWYRETFGCTAPGGASLLHVCGKFELRVPDKYGQNVVGSTLSMLRARFLAGRGYGELTLAQRQRWVAVVKHNQWDVRRMQSVLTRIARLGTS